MLTVLLLAGLVLGPLLLVRVRTLPPAPGGIVVSPTTPTLDMAVVVDADPDDAVVKPLVASLTGQRPQPAHVVISRGATAPAGVDVIVDIEPTVVLASPEALDRIAAELEKFPAIAVQPWAKTTARAEAVGMFRVLLLAMGRGTPTGLRARKAAAPGEAYRVYRGGHIVAQRADGWRHDRPNVVTTVAALVFFACSAAAAAWLIVDPTWPHFGLYAAYVFSLSLCLRQVGKFARLATAIYPVPLVLGAAAALGRKTRSAS